MIEQLSRYAITELREGCRRCREAALVAPAVVSHGRDALPRVRPVRPVSVAQERDPPVCMDIGMGLRVKNVSAETDIFQSRKIVADLIVSMAVWRDMVVRMYLRFPAGIATPSPTGRVATGLPANSSNTAT